MVAFFSIPSAFEDVFAFYERWARCDAWTTDHVEHTADEAVLTLVRKGQHLAFVFSAKARDITFLRLGIKPARSAIYREAAKVEAEN